MINKINRLNFSVISSKLGENNINNDTEIPIINNKSNFKSMIDDFKNSYRTNRYWGNSGNYGVSLPEKSMTISEYLEKPILDNIDYDVFHVRPQTSVTWNSSSGLSSTKIVCICLTVIGSTVIAGTYFGGLYYSEDNGHTWQNSDIDKGNFQCLITIGSTVIAGGQGKGLYYSEDNGKTWNKSDIQLKGVNCLTTIVSKSDSTCTCIAGTSSSDSTHLFYTESITEPLEFKEEREQALEFLNSSDPKNEQLIYNSILSKLFLDWLDYTLVKDCSLNTKYTKYKDEAIVKESIDDNILTNNRIVYGNGPYFRFTDKYKC